MHAQKQKQAQMEMASSDQLSSKPSSARGSKEQVQSHTLKDTTVLQEIQLRYKLATSTFKLLLDIPTSPSRKDVLKQACLATEFRTFPIKQVEKGFLHHVNDNTNIPYPVPEHISEPWHKVFLIVQVNLSHIEWRKLSGQARKELYGESGRINKLLEQLLRCLVDILGDRGDGRGVHTALDMLRSVKAGVWEGNNDQLRQVTGIGTNRLEKLIKANIRSIRRLSQLDGTHIELLLSRQAPFGETMVRELSGFPGLNCSVEVLDVVLSGSASSTRTDKAGPVINGTYALPAPVWAVRVVLNYTNRKVPVWKKHSPWVTLLIEGQDGRLVWFWRGSIKRLEGGKEMVIGLGAMKGEVLKVEYACEEIVGTKCELQVQI